jgi:pyruvate carboxylase
VFIGPPPEAMEAMGGKISARKIAIQAGVPVVPGTTEPLRSFEDARTTAARFGYPVMLKASAGGGGKGMRLVDEEGGLKAALEMAQSEAFASFGDDAVLYRKKRSFVPVISRSRFFLTCMETMFTLENGNARSSVVIKRSSKNVPSPINSP